MKGCYQPILITKNRIFNKTKMIAYNLRNYKTDLHSDEFVNEAIEVPCGKCLACLSKKSDEWAMRMQQESISYNYGMNGAFITLTYNADNLPDNYSLRKKDLQNFFKRLRKKIGNRKIKYFACGEYGTIGKRPHYHVSLLGLSYYNEKDKQLINSSWQKGYVHIGYVSQESIIYTCKYMQKDNLLFLNDKQYLAMTKREKPFRVMSKGIGKKYALENFNNIMNNLALPFNGTFLSIPRAYLKWFYKYFNTDVVREKIKLHSFTTMYKDLWTLAKKHALPVFDEIVNIFGEKQQVINKSLQRIINHKNNIKKMHFEKQNQYYYDKKYQENLLKPIEIF